MKPQPTTILSDELLCAADDWKQTHFLLLGTFMDMILGPWNTTPQPPVITRLHGSPVSGSFLSGGSFIFCTTSNLRGRWPFFFGMVS